MSLRYHHLILPQDVRGGRQPELHAEPAEPGGVGVQPGEDGPRSGDGGDGGGSPGGVQEAAGRKHSSTSLRHLTGEDFALVRFPDSLAESRNLTCLISTFASHSIGYMR